MKTKKLLSMVTVLCLVLSVVSAPTAFALWEDAVTLYESDFENETVDAFPRTVINPFDTSLTSTNYVVTAQGAANSGNATKYIQIKQRVRMWFNNPVSSGAFIAEFDMNPGDGKIALGLVYNSSSTTYAKWPVWLGGEGNVMGYTKLNGLPPAIKEEYGTKQFLKASDSSALTFKANTWQHYKVKLDYDKKEVTVWIDGVKSNTITGYEYFTEAIGGIGFYVNDTNGATQKCIDNIKIYKENDYATYLVKHDFESGKGSFRYNDPIDITYTDTPITSLSTGNQTKYLTFGNTNPGLTARPTRVMFANDASITTGKLFVEFDVYTAFGGIGVAVFGASDVDHYGEPYKKFILGAGSGFSTPARGLKAYTKAGQEKFPPAGNAGSFDYIVGYRASGASTDLALTANAWQHIKLEVDLDSESVKCTLDGVESQAVTGFEYLTDINGIGFTWTPYSNDLTDTKYFEAYIDNIKAYTASDGDSVKSVLCGGNKIKLTFKDAVSALTNETVSVYKADGTVVEIESVTLASDGKSAMIVTSTEMTEGSEYIVSLGDSVTYADGYAIYEKTQAFTYSKGSFDVTIDNFTASYNAGDIVNVNYTFNATDNSTRNIELIVAAYNGKMLTDVVLVPVTFTDAYFAGQEQSVTIRLTKDADKITAFAWDGKTVTPLCASVSKEKQSN